MSLEKILVGVLLSLSFTSSISTYTSSSRIIANCIPKCGTHLLARCLHLMTGREVKALLSTNGRGWIERSPNKVESVKDWPSDMIMLTHLTYKDQFVGALKQDYLPFFIYRDPRDQIISLAHYVYQKANLWPKSQRFKFDDLLTHLITDGKEVYGEKLGICGFYKKYLPWIKDKRFCVTTFEKLVGSKGGGSHATQKAEVRKIATHLGLVYTDLEVEEIAHNLFGVKPHSGFTNTFRKGQIGAWKECFTKEHILLFKKHAGQLLIELGYENDLDW